MYNKIKKMMFAFTLLLVIVSSGAWQSSNTAFAAPAVPETPLAPDLAWTNRGQEVRSIQLNIKGDALDLSGQTFQAGEKFADGVPSRVSDFYSNVNLAKAGWSSHNAYEAADGLHLIFYHEAGYYLAVEYLKCSDDPSATCVTVWKSAHKDTANFMAGNNPEIADPNPSAIFGKKTPVDGSTGINPSSVYLSWDKYTGTQKYSYCIKEGADCPKDDPDWTGTMLNTSITLTNLNPNKNYHWNVKAITCLDCKPKEYILADGGKWWGFTTTISTVKISGNAGSSYATLRWTDGVAKSTSADSNGDYSIYVSYNWSGTITPSKSGYTFVPANRSYTNLTSNLIGQNFAAITAVTISGNAGVAGAVLSFTDGVAKTVTADATGNYSIQVTYNWSGKVVPSLLGYVFTPLSRTYTNVLSNIPAQNYIAVKKNQYIQGDAGVSGATLKYIVNGVQKSVMSGANGTYRIVVPYGWSGKVVPSKAGVTAFVPTSRTYSNVKANILNQNYQANILSIFTSNGTQDGYILESTETSGIGGGFLATSPVIKIGDYIQDRQYRGVLSFDTSSLPDNAVILLVRVKLTLQSITGTNPITSFGNIYFDIKSPFFGAGSILENADFGDPSGLNSVGWLGSTPVGKVYTGTINSGGFSRINRTGLTQLRFRFQLDDNDNNIADFASFYSGDASISAYRPVLRITYYVP